MNQQLGRRSRRHVIRMAAMTIASLPWTAAKAQIVLSLGPDRGRPPMPPRPPGPGHAQCLLRGTMIWTPAGERPIENLRIGDAVVTLDGTPQPIRWIGTSRFPLPRHSRSSGRGLPIKVARSAVADGVPARDLYLSPDHALYVDGCLVPVKYLENGGSIRAALPNGAEDLAYFHIECDRHYVVFAEGAPVETLLVYEPALRERFSNFVEYERAYGRDTVTMVPFAPFLRYDGIGAEALALARLYAATAFDIRDPLQVVYDRIALRSAAMAPAAHS